jgi:CheY-like chemotaxis protein
MAMSPASMPQAVPRILVADDDPEIRKLLARYIESQGFRVALAANCAELRERLATSQIDLIVLDVMLPDGSGLDVCRDLRAERSRIPIILLTALKEDVDRIVGLEIGADDYLGIQPARANRAGAGSAPPRCRDAAAGSRGHGLLFRGSHRRSAHAARDRRQRRRDRPHGR